MIASSGDVLADRRYAWAEAALAEGDFAAAADLAAQTVELAPAYAAGWFLLGQARHALFEDDGEPTRCREAVAAYETALALDPADRQGAALRLAALGVGDPLRAMPPDYIRALFDEYAPRFDRHLTRSLGYRGPEVVHGAVRRACSRVGRPFRFARALDLGCGTGLAGEAFRPQCDVLVGVDLAPAMVAKARAKHVYDALQVGEVVAWLGAEEGGSADLVLAVDVFVYLGDLAPVFHEAARVLVAGSLLALSVQAADGDGIRLGSDLRYAHGERYLRDQAETAGMSVLLLEPVSTRQDRGLDVPGRVAVFQR